MIGFRAVTRIIGHQKLRPDFPRFMECRFSLLFHNQVVVRSSVVNMIGSGTLSKTVCHAMVSDVTGSGVVTRNCHQLLNE